MDHARALLGIPGGDPIAERSLGACIRRRKVLPDLFAVTAPHKDNGLRKLQGRLGIELADDGLRVKEQRVSDLYISGPRLSTLDRGED
jgi:hypothetical protein